MCSVEGCDRPPRTGGMCKLHYERLRLHGRLGLKPKPTADERFLRHVEKQADGCWIWKGQLSHNGYGRYVLRWEGKKSIRVPAHKWAYERWVGPTPEGCEFDHYVCERPSCCNPHHVRPVTHWENILRGRSFSAVNAAKTECVNGHPFTPDNTYVSRGGTKRSCIACRNIRSAEYQRRKRAAAKQAAPAAGT